MLRRSAVMSFGFSPSDVVKLVEVSTRVYLAFKGMLLPALSRCIRSLTSSEMQMRILKPRWEVSCGSSRPSISAWLNSTS